MKLRRTGIRVGLAGHGHRVGAGRYRLTVTQGALTLLHRTVRLRAASGCGRIS